MSEGPGGWAVPAHLKRATGTTDPSLSLGSAEVLREAARAVATAMHLPLDWLNDGAKAYLHGLALGDRVFVSPNLIVHAVAPRQLLAMKLCAWRDDIDIADARLLLSKLKGDRSAVWGEVEPYLVPGRDESSICIRGLVGGRSWIFMSSFGRC